MLRIESRQNYTCPLDVFGTSPSQIQPLGLDGIRKMPVYLGNRKRAFGDLFEVSGDTNDQQQVWCGDLTRINGIGHDMHSGWIQIEGNAGNHVGSRMSGGIIQVTGDVGSYVGAEMTDGLIQVRGNADSCVGAAYSGATHGMNGGAIIVEGSAGSAVGQLMRRGVIAIGGNVGGCCGNGMHAGTIVIGGKPKMNLGLDMVRGTIIVLGTVDLQHGFVSNGSASQPIIVTMIDRYLRELGFSRSIQRDIFELFHGDPLMGCRGEILVAV